MKLIKNLTDIVNCSKRVQINIMNSIMESIRKNDILIGMDPEKTGLCVRNEQGFKVVNNDMSEFYLKEDDDIPENLKPLFMLEDINSSDPNSLLFVSVAYTSLDMDPNAGYVCNLNESLTTEVKKPKDFGFINIFDKDINNIDHASFINPRLEFNDDVITEEIREKFWNAYINLKYSSEDENDLLSTGSKETLKESLITFSDSVLNRINNLEYKLLDENFKVKSNLNYVSIIVGSDIINIGV